MYVAGRPPLPGGEGDRRTPSGRRRLTPPGRRRRTAGNTPSTRSATALLIAAPNVLFLGLTSLITDIASEMVASVLPLYLTMRLGFSALRFGATDGLLQIVAAATALVGALFADRWRRYRETAGGGYALSAASRLGLLAAPGWLPVLTLLGADRVGKGIRTGPRDAIISLSAPPGRLAEAFGLHRAMDTGGALAGPLLALVLLQAAPGSYPTVFAAGFLIAIIGLAVLALFVENPPPPPPVPILFPPPGSIPEAGLVPAQDGRAAASVPAPASPPRRWWTPVTVLWAQRPLRRLLAATLLLSLPAVGDSMLFLTLRHEAGLSSGLFPSLFVVESVCFLGFAVPFGRLADRVGAGRVLLGGQAVLAGCFAVLAGQHGGPLPVLALPVLLGLYFAATDGVLASLASRLVPGPARTTGLALVGLVLAVGRAVATIGFGAVWTRSGPAGAVTAGLLATLVSALFAAMLLRPFLSGSALLDAGPATPVVGPAAPVVREITAAPAVTVVTAGLAVTAGTAVTAAISTGSATSTGSRRRPVRGRIVIFSVVVLVCLTAAVGVTVRAARLEGAAARTAVSRSARAGGHRDTPTVPLTAALLSGRHLLVLDAAEGPDFGRLEAVDPSRPAGPRAPAALVCDRVDERAGRGICLTYDRVHTQGGITVFDENLAALSRLPAEGLPSRARVAPDGRLGAATTFVAGDAYNTDSYSTRTVLVDLSRGRVVADLEQFAVYRDGHRFHAADGNFWGVTFAADSDTFYATMGTADHYYLIRGHVRGRRAEILRDGVECPSLSPDGTRVAYKSRNRHGFDPATWRLHVLDLSTGVDHPLAETRDVDDQVAWLDGDHVSYAVAAGGTGPALADTWTVPADGTGTPRLLVPAAQSVVMVAATTTIPTGSVPPSAGGRP
ncbi:MFS transporter [Frankia sp. R43]|uniref:MFS transporter n=1 Tax=Frankia sp. R43 TaxID=269536 RepID=UPI0006CA17D2|nr:MFS transporter [Frankia sp. R43]